MSKSPNTTKFTWKEDSEQEQLLQSLIVSGEAFRCKPGQLFAKYELFKDHVSAQVFRNHLSDAKKYFKKMNADVVPAPTNVVDKQEDVNPENSVSTTEKTESTADADIAVGAKRKNSPNKVEHKKRPTWNCAVPAHWMDSATNEFVDAFFLLPSGVHSNKQYSMYVSECGKKIILELIWPSSIATADILTKIAQVNDPEITKHHPLIGGITKVLMEHKDNINDGVVREYEVELPIIVQQAVKFIKARELKDGSKIVHIRLQGITDNFANMTRDEGAIQKLSF